MPTVTQTFAMVEVLGYSNIVNNKNIEELFYYTSGFYGNCLDVTKKIFYTTI